MKPSKVFRYRCATCAKAACFDELREDSRGKFICSKCYDAQTLRAGIDAIRSSRLLEVKAMYDRKLAELLALRSRRWTRYFLYVPNCSPNGRANGDI